MNSLTTFALTLILSGLTGITQAHSISDFSYHPSYTYEISGKSYTGPTEFVRFVGTGEVVPSKYPSANKTITTENPGIKLDETTYKSFSFRELTKHANKDNGVFTIGAGQLPGEIQKGDFRFANVANQGVYYGVWSDNYTGLKNPAVAFYSGISDFRSLPSTTVTYAVQGINNYSATSALSGTLTASFDQAKPLLRGNLSNDIFNLNVNSIIDKTDASFQGNAFVTDKITNTQILGESRGSFFGTGGRSSLAGIAVFDDHKYDTAFGGSLKDN